MTVREAERRGLSSPLRKPYLFFALRLAGFFAAFLAGFFAFLAAGLRALLAFLGFAITFTPLIP